MTVLPRSYPRQKIGKLRGLVKIIKVIPDVFDQGITGLPFNPVVVDSLRRN
ncbi:hypothetical protein [Nodularia spumigena]|uniref:hypothetical protein n=1 Tax=Nodularia spumigena TaxID=70799 RepID=UPI002330B910|nr:hypothetical protein [Nodularia spumigena]MDB9323163.1 hypothetical protein [Nodularia spumigena CS-591/07A]MDB9335008.1 hypothetical protein [Nodularia spumigena CS-590/01]MDB9339004.1 hypothetical protein [Nodularia spumigena CS-589/07]MDB9353975.1 hypothetical protein [Nodularia spumigena CS-588/05]